MIRNRSEKVNISRRNFLGFAWGISILALFGQAGIALLQFFKPRIESGTFGSRVVAGQVDEFQPSTVSHIPKGTFYISRLEDAVFWHSGSNVPIWDARYLARGRQSGFTVRVLFDFRPRRRSCQRPCATRRGRIPRRNPG
jgi:hypothetical protein